jgi:hypothetical protein
MNRNRSPWGWHTFHPTKLVLFALLSVADLFMTWQLVQATDGKVYESNPVANAWLTSFGWVGLTIFKTLAMLLVALTAVYISFHRPKTGGRVLIFACTATFLVVAYSCYIGLQEEPLNLTGTEDSFEAEQKGRILDKERARQRQYAKLLAQLSDALVARRLTLREAVDQLAQSEKARNPQWIAMFHRTYPGRSDAECLAINLIKHALSSVSNDPAARDRLASQLETEYQTTFGSEVILDLVSLTNDEMPPATRLPLTPGATPVVLCFGESRS